MNLLFEILSFIFLGYFNFELPISFEISIEYYNLVHYMFSICSYQNSLLNFYKYPILLL